MKQSFSIQKVDYASQAHIILGIDVTERKNAQFGTYCMNVTFGSYMAISMRT